MRNILSALMLLLAVGVTAQPAPSVSVTDFSQAMGQMKGTLTYLDYSSGKPYTMPALITLRNTEGLLIRSLEYPDEPKANQTDTLLIGAKGTFFNGAKLVKKETLPDGSLQLVTEKAGKDGNDHKSATLRNTYTFGKNLIVIRKDVRFEGEEKWIQRHEYSFQR